MSTEWFTPKDCREALEVLCTELSADDTIEALSKNNRRILLRSFSFIKGDDEILQDAEVLAVIVRLQSENPIVRIQDIGRNALCTILHKCVKALDRKSVSDLHTHEEKKEIVRWHYESISSISRDSIYIITIEEDDRWRIIIRIHNTKDTAEIFSIDRHDPAVLSRPTFMHESHEMARELANRGLTANQILKELQKFAAENR